MVLNRIFKKQTDEEKFVARIQEGDMAASKRLYDENARYLTAVCSRYVSNDEDVKDVMQEAFLHIYSAIGSFHCRGEGSLRGWMARIVLNESISYLRKNNRLNCCDLDTDHIDMTDEVQTERIPTDVIYNAIRELPDGYRTVFNLYVVEQKSHKEIAALLGIKPDTSASQLHKAKAMLAKSLRQYERDNC